MFGKNTARCIYSLLYCYTYYLVVQLRTNLSVAMVTDLKKRQAKELMAMNCNAPDLCEKKLLRQFPSLDMQCALHFLCRRRIFTVALPVFDIIRLLVYITIG